MQSENSKRTLSILDYLKVFTSHKKSISIILGIILVVSILLAFFIIDPIFFSNGVIKTASKSSSMLGGLLGGSGLPDLGDFGDLAGGGGGASAELALYENILMSRRCIEETILKFNLFEEYKYKYMYDALKDFRENILEVSKDKIAGTISIGIYDKDPKRAKDIADFLIFQLNKINIELNVLNAKNNRLYLQDRFDVVKKDLAKSEDSLRMYQDKFGISPDLTIQAAVKAEIELEGEIKSEEIKLELLRKILSPDQAEIKSQEEKIVELKKQMVSLKTNTDDNTTLRLKGSPKIIIDFLRLKREVEIQNKILTTILPLFEQSKIEEKKETPTILVLDTPQVPDKKTKPKRLYIILVSLMVGFVVTYIYFFVKDIVLPKFKQIDAS